MSNARYTLDEVCRRNLDEEPTRAVPWFLATSVLYYRPELAGEATPLSVITDECFDYVAKFILANWEACQSHQHASYLCKDDLNCGSGYALAYETLPSRILGGARSMAALWRERNRKTRAPRGSKGSGAKTVVSPS